MTRPRPLSSATHGQDQRVGVRREPADGEVRDGEQGQVGEPHPEQRLRERLLLVGLDEHERERDDHGGERQQHQLDAPPRRQGRGIGRGGPGPVAARRHQLPPCRSRPGCPSPGGAGWWSRWWVGAARLGCGRCRARAPVRARAAAGAWWVRGGRDDRAGLEHAVAQPAAPGCGRRRARRSAMMPSLTALRSLVGEVVDGDVGVLDDLVQRQPEHVALHALEDRDLVAVDADVVLLHHPQPGQRRPPRRARARPRATAASDPQPRPLAGRAAATGTGSTRGRARVIVVAEARGGRRIGARTLVAAVADGAADDRVRRRRSRCRRRPRRCR